MDSDIIIIEDANLAMIKHDHKNTTSMPTQGNSQTDNYARIGSHMLVVEDREQKGTTSSDRYRMSLKGASEGR